MTVAQVFLACVDFLLFIVLGVIYARQIALFRKLRETNEMNLETRRRMGLDTEEQRRWLEAKFGVKGARVKDKNHG